MNKQTTEKRLFQYALYFKKTIIIGLVCLMFAVAFELSGPFIAKRLIDQHIVGVENHYVITDSQDGVDLEGKHYVRVDRAKGKNPTPDVTLFQDGLTFYLLEGKVPLQSTIKDVNGSAVTLAYQEESIEVAGEKLSATEVFAFFQRRDETGHLVTCPLYGTHLTRFHLCIL